MVRVYDHHGREHGSKQAGMALRAHILRHKHKRPETCLGRKVPVLVPKRMEQGCGGSGGGDTI